MTTEVRKGYKQSEIGVIPEDWEVKSISSFADIATGNTPPTRDLSNYGDEFMFIGPADLGKRKWILNSEKKLSRKGFNISRKFPPCSILFTCIGSTIGKSGMATIELTSNQQINAVLPNEYYHSDFLYYSLNFLSPKIKALAGEQAVPLVNKTQFGETLVPIPPTKSEQTAISTALSDADALITSLEKLIEKKRAIKQGAMQELLKPKEGWEVKKLGEIAEVVGGGTPSTFVSEYWNGTINWFTPTEIGTKKYSFESQRKLTKKGFSNCSAKMLPVGTILLTSRAGIGDLSILTIEGCTNQGFQSLISKDGYSNEYIYYLMLTLKNELLQNASGSTFLEISPNKIKQIEISISDYEEQTRIATILSDIDAEITALEQKLAKYKQIKQGMMQELLTGKIRLNQDLQDYWIYRINMINGIKGLMVLQN